MELDWMSQEQKFLHQRVMMDAKKLDKDGLMQIFEMVHKQSLINKRLFSSLASWCARNQVTLPAFDELLEQRPVVHPVEEN
jgi:hypothetical protein